MVMQALRQGKGSKALKIGLSILVLMAIMGLALMDILENLVRGGAPTATTVLATVGGQAITAQDFQAMARPVLERLKLSPAEAQKMGVMDQILEQQINTILIARAAQDSGISVGDDVVIKQVADIASQIAPKGTSPREAMAAALQKQGMNEKTFTAALREDMAAMILTKALTTGVAIQPNDAIVSDMYLYMGEERDLALVMLAYAEAPKPTTPPTTQDLKALYEAKKTPEFVVPERRAFTLAELVVEKELNPQALADRADALDTALVGGAKVKDIAKNMNLRLTAIESVDKNGEGKGAEVLAKWGTDKTALLDVGFALTQGEASSVLELSDGRFVVIVPDKVELQNFIPFAQAKDKLEEAWTDTQKRIATRTQAETMLATLKSGQTNLSTLAQKTKSHMQTIKNITRDTPALPLPLVPEALPVLFKTPMGGYVILDLPHGLALVKILKTRLPKKEDINKEEATRIAQELNLEIQNEIMSLYLTNARKKWGVTVYSDRLARLSESAR